MWHIPQFMCGLEAFICVYVHVWHRRIDGFGWAEANVCCADSALGWEEGAGHCLRRPRHHMLIFRENQMYLQYTVWHLTWFIKSSIHISILALQKVCHHQFQIPACMYWIYRHMLSCMAKRSSPKVWCLWLVRLIQVEIWCSRCFFKTFMCKQQAHIFILWVEEILSSARLYIIIPKLKTVKHYQSKTYPTISCQWLQSRFLFEKKTQQQFHPNQRNTIHLMHQRETSRPSY